MTLPLSRKPLSRRPLSGILTGLLALLLLNVAVQQDAVAQTLRLGKITVHSLLGQRLDAEIEIRNMGNLDIDDVVPRLADKRAFERLGMKRRRELNDLRFAVQADGDYHYIKVTSRRSQTDPFLAFVVELTWPTGRTLRVYTVSVETDDANRPQDRASKAGSSMGRLAGNRELEEALALARDDANRADRTNRNLQARIDNLVSQLNDLKERLEARDERIEDLEVSARSARRGTPRSTDAPPTDIGMEKSKKILKDTLTKIPYLEDFYIPDHPLVNQAVLYSPLVALAMVALLLLMMLYKLVTIFSAVVKKAKPLR